MFYAQDISEHINYLQINPLIEQIIYSVKVSEIKKGDVLHVTTEFEATNQNAFNVMIGTKIILTGNENDTSGTLIDQANGFNITPNMHHGVISKSRNWKAKSTYENKYVNVVLWALSDNALPQNQLIIEKGYGHLDVIIY